MARKNNEEEDLIEKGDVLGRLAVQKLKGKRLSILVVGEAGSGKSTLISTLLGNDCTFMGIPTTFHEITLYPLDGEALIRVSKELTDNNLIIILCVNMTNQPTLENTFFSKFLSNYYYLLRGQDYSNIMRKCILTLTHADHCLLDSELETHRMLWCNVFKGCFQRYKQFEHIIIDNTPVCIAARDFIPGITYDWKSVLWFCCM